MPQKTNVAARVTISRTCIGEAETSSSPWREKTRNGVQGRLKYTAKLSFELAGIASHL